MLRMTCRGGVSPPIIRAPFAPAIAADIATVPARPASAPRMTSCIPPSPLGPERLVLIHSSRETPQATCRRLRARLDIPSRELNETQKARAQGDGFHGFEIFFGFAL